MLSPVKCVKASWVDIAVVAASDWGHVGKDLQVDSFDWSFAQTGYPDAERQSGRYQAPVIRRVI